MNLTKEKWTTKDMQTFEAYLKSIQNADKLDWSKKLLNSNLPTYALYSNQTKQIATLIAEGNWQNFLSVCKINSVEESYIYGSLLTKFEDFDTLTKHLKILAEKADNWATCDCIPFKNIKKENKQKLFSVAKQFVKSEKPFTKRIGLRILFEFKRDAKHFDEIFEILNSFEKETHYYVNMIIAWLVCEMFVINKTETLKFLQTHKLNKFSINKAISKCRDSFRVSSEDKEMLLSYRVK